MTDWQPIETAPFEQRVWLYIPYFPAPANQMMVGIRYSDNLSWGVEHGTLRYLTTEQQPTHWKPLPDPPQGDNP